MMFYLKNRQGSRKSLVLMFLIFCIAICSVNVRAQTKGNSNTFSGKSVSLISDGQLNDFWSNAKRLGYTYQTVTKLLQEGGFSYTEALNIVDRIRALNSVTSSDPFSVLASMPFEKLTAYEKKIYGLKLFYLNDFSFTDYNTLATPSSYVLGTGDGLSVVVYGETSANYSLGVDKEGRVQLPVIGPFTIAGLEFEAAKSLIKQKLVRLHAGLNSNDPKTFLDITLTSARAITVNILGEVLKAGTYSIPSTTSVFSALYKAGGPTSKGTLRKIKIFRSNQLILETDLYDFISKGYTDQQFVLNDQDVIVLSTYSKRVEILGAVRSPGIFELNGEESIADILKFSGGYTPGADSTLLTLKRLNGSDQFIRKISPAFSTSELLDGDVVEVLTLEDYDLERVEIAGAVLRPGFYSWSADMTLDGLIQMAGGFRKDALQNRVTVFKLNDDLTPKLNSIMSSDVGSFANTPIDIRTTVYIPSRLSVSEPYFIQVAGQVNREGALPFYEGMTLLDAIVLSDGIKTSAIGGNVEIVRPTDDDNSGIYEYFDVEIPENIENIENFRLKQNDIIHIRDSWKRRKNRSIFVKGDIDRPGEYIISQGNTRVSDLAQRFGGFLPTANLNGLKLYRQVRTVDSQEDSTEYDRRESIANFINDSRFEGTVSKLQYDQIKQSFGKLENDRILTNPRKDESRLESDSINVLNNFKLSKQFIVNNELVELIEIGLNFDDILSNVNSQYNVKLLDGDILFVPSKSTLIEIDGAVFQPTQAIYKKEKSFLDYIETAGGFKRRADKRRAYVEYANGEIARVRSFVFFKFYPKVTTDAIIKVPMKPESQKFNFDRAVSLITTTISTYLLIEAVSNR